VLAEISIGFAADWICYTCPVCQGGKWENSPFCRSCTLRVQRLKLMRGWRSFTGHSMAVITRMGDLERWIFWYDLCRDYLTVTRKQGKDDLVLADSRLPQTGMVGEASDSGEPNGTE